MSYRRSAAEDVLAWKLQFIKDRQYELPTGHDPGRIVHEILDFLGTPDTELRDTLGYTVLSELIEERNLLNSEQLRAVLSRALSAEMLLYRLGDVEEDSVFLRSFSCLVIALVLLRDNRREPFLTSEELQQIMQHLLRYCREEADLRGYVPGKGWAHAAAHAADAIDECVRNRHSTAADCAALWQGLRALVHSAAAVYGFEEDERLAMPLFAMVETGKVSVATLCAWLAAEHPDDSTTYESRIRRTNWKHLTRCLYFRLHEHDLLGDDEERLLRMQKAFTLF